MNITIELASGNKDTALFLPTKRDIQENIDALSRAVEGKQKTTDFQLIMDSISILEGIQRQLTD